jgi:hypothetical protein
MIYIIEQFGKQGGGNRKQRGIQAISPEDDDDNVGIHDM